jgi:hypothetical protein
VGNHGLPLYRRHAWRAGLAGIVLAMATTAAAAVPAAAAPPAPDEAPANTWTAALSAIGADDVNVAYTNDALRLTTAASAPASQRLATPEGMLLLAPHTLATPANRITADFDGRTHAGASVEARGLSGGVWSEWRQAGTALPTAVSTIQVRIVLTGAISELDALTLTADLAGPIAPAPNAATAGLTYRVYATREGLVGGTTANGHVIATRDHFVALPSRRGLAPKNTGDYTVKVCTTSGSRCEFAPVWDVGPWNTTDDYWNPPGTRQSWTDLAQGTPEAQAAYLTGYNGGKDQSGRTVSNPAGIDLGDGVFYDGLQLSNNAYVNVSYLWTGTGSRGVVGSGPLNVRSGAGTSFGSVGYAATYAQVPIECYVTGQSVAGPYGTTTRWDRVGTNQYISHAYVSSTSGTAATTC